MTTLSPPAVSLRTGSLRTAGVLVLALASGLACTAIFKPRDNVQRCGTSDDCESTGDNRYVPQCRFDPENMDLDSTKVDKICVADFAVIGCRPEDWDNGSGEHQFTEKVDECDGLVLECDADRLGTEYCGPPPGEACDAGLEAINGICLDDGSDEMIVSDAEFREQAVLDQFCKSYFCDEEFVCDASDMNATCVRCDPDLPFGEGGCGLLYANGAPAPVYVLGDDLEEQCDAGNADPDDMLFGDCP